MTRKNTLTRLLVANRAEIACRVIRTARELGIETVAVYSEPDREAAHVAEADRAVALGGDCPATSYLDIQRILGAAQSCRADSIHPGYGFLAENAEFAATVEQAGLTFVGPEPATIAALGDKIQARRLAQESGLPVIPCAELGNRSPSDAAAAGKLGYPILVKAAAGGGGRGMRIVGSADSLEACVKAARRESAAAFGDDRVYLEKYLSEPRHVEIQVFGDGRGNVVQLGERECSVQRRHQKIIEESPSPAVTEPLRERMAAAAVSFARALSYRGAGTVEFLLDADGSFYFLEMNTRLQVEHPVTELVTGTDLVAWQLEIASGANLPERVPSSRGHSMECRIYAEDPANSFLPTGGRVLRFAQPEGPGVRVDSALLDGLEIPLEYDPLLAKVIVWAPNRQHTITRMLRALRGFSILGVTTNIPFLIDLLEDKEFAQGRFTTATVETRYADWKPRRGTTFEIAALAAAILASRRGSSALAAAAEQTRAPGPWETLGPWRPGMGKVKEG